MPSAAIDDLVAEVAELRPLPAAALRVLGITESDRFSAHELAKAIAFDQALTAKVLRLANSAYYGFPRRITSVRDAVVLLGFRAIRQATLASCVIETLRGGTTVDYERFWHFSTTVGLLSEVMARARREHLEDAFTAGVLHNIGRLALDQHRPEWLRQARTLAHARGTSVADAECELLGFSDAALGGALATHWGFPEDLVDAVARHQSAIESLQDAGSLAGVVIRSRGFAQSYGMTDGIDPAMARQPEREWELPPLLTTLHSFGGVQSIRERADVFVQSTVDG